MYYLALCHLFLIERVEVDRKLICETICNWNECKVVICVRFCRLYWSTIINNQHDCSVYFDQFSTTISYNLNFRISLPLFTLDTCINKKANKNNPIDIQTIHSFHLNSFWTKIKIQMKWNEWNQKQTLKFINHSETATFSTLSVCIIRTRSENMSRDTYTELFSYIYISSVSDTGSYNL